VPTRIFPVAKNLLLFNGLASFQAEVFSVSA
jgi:hypothetical protein